LNDKDLKDILKTVFLGSCVLNIASYLISVIFLGFTLPIAAGLVCGTLGVLTNLFLLGRSVNEIVNSKGRRGNTRMFLGYLVRAGIMVVIVSAASFVSIPCMIGAAVPLIYPKLIYGGKTLLGRRKKTE
jgi:hypothetical protein